MWCLNFHRHLEKAVPVGEDEIPFWICVLWFWGFRGFCFVYLCVYVSLHCECVDLFLNEGDHTEVTVGPFINQRSSVSSHLWLTEILGTFFRILGYQIFHKRIFVNNMFNWDTIDESNFKTKLQLRPHHTLYYIKTNKTFFIIKSQINLTFGHMINYPSYKFNYIFT